MAVAARPKFRLTGSFAFLAAFLRRVEQMVATHYMYNCIVKFGREKKEKHFTLSEASPSS
jgi:hypothetical protein